jgi:hypothetical protein
MFSQDLGLPTGITRPSAGLLIVIRVTSRCRRHVLDSATLFANLFGFPLPLPEDFIRKYILFNNRVDYFNFLDHSRIHTLIHDDKKLTLKTASSRLSPNRFTITRVYLRSRQASSGADLLHHP